MEREATDLVARAGVAAADVTRQLSAMMRYKGQGYEIETLVPPNLMSTGSIERLLELFCEAYKRRYGRAEAMPAEVLSWRLVIEGPNSTLGDSLMARMKNVADPNQSSGNRDVWFDSAFVQTPVYQRAALSPGANIVGPIIVEETESTTVVPPDFKLHIDSALNIVLTRI